MSSKAITEKLDETLAPRRRPAMREEAPSFVRAETPFIPRLIGALGLVLIVLGGVPLGARLGADRAVLRMLSELVPTWLAALFAVVGLGCLLFHAANEAELQIRRSYMVKGLAWLALGAGFTLWPAAGAGGVPVFATHFLPFGLLGLFLGLLFLMAFVRNETDPEVRGYITYLLGGVGGLLAVCGFLFGTLFGDFLIPGGVLFILLGLLFLWSFVGLRGAADDLGARTGLALGALGGLAFLVAFVRSVVVPAMAARGWVGPVEGYAIPNGLALMGCGVLYAALAAGLYSDNSLIVLTRRELASIFFSPIAYTVLMGFAFIAWGLFWFFVIGELWNPEPAAGDKPSIELEEPIVVHYILGIFPVICVIFLVPVVTMRMLSEEQRTGTLEMLLTAPLNETAVVVSKFTAGFVFFMLAWVPWVLYLVALRAEGGKEFDYLPVVAFFIALAASGAGFVAMGVFFSSLTRNQIAAAILTFVGMLVMTSFAIIPRLARSAYPNLATVSEHISYYHLWVNAVQGRLTVRDLVFHVSAAVFWLFATVKVLESRKWR